MKKIIALIFVLVGFLGFWFTTLDICPGTEINWLCCPFWEFHYDNNTKCCKWIIYDNDTKCCENWIVTQNECISCSSPEAQNLPEYKTYCSRCDWKVYKNGQECCPSWSHVYDNNKKCCNWSVYDNNKKCCEKWVWILNADKCILCSSPEAENLTNYKEHCSEDISDCEQNKIYEDSKWLKKCCPWMLVPDSQDSSKMACITNTQWNLGINMNSDCLINWQCSYNIYKTLWIRQSDQNPSVSTFVQDIVLGITMFLGTAITIILIISGILYILAAILGKSNLADMAKKWIFNSILWLVLVSWSYAIVRLVQFVATAGGW